MADEIHFEEFPPTLPAKRKRKHKALALASDPEAPKQLYTKPADILNALPPNPATIFYLAVIKPHTDTYTVHGPVPAFRHLLPEISKIVSNSASAITKLEALRTTSDTWGAAEPNQTFEKNGFDTFVVEGQRRVYTVLKILREEKLDVAESLPAPVYTVIAAGPLRMPGREAARAAGKGRLVGPKGRAGKTRVVGSFVARGEARRVAERAMGKMVGEMKGAQVEEQWEKGSKGGGVLMAMSGEGMCEVRVVYEDQVLKRAREGLEQKGGKVGWRF